MDGLDVKAHSNFRLILRMISEIDEPGLLVCLYHFKQSFHGVDARQVCDTLAREQVYDDVHDGGTRLVPSEIHDLLFFICDYIILGTVNSFLVGWGDHCSALLSRSFSWLLAHPNQNRCWGHSLLVNKALVCERACLVNSGVINWHLILSKMGTYVFGSRIEDCWHLSLCINE